MAKHIEVGKKGEQIAADFLRQNGYTIAEQNWRWGKAEADIIAWDRAVLVFVEVKTRRSAAFGYPEEQVTRKKQQLLYELAGEYMYRHHHEGEIRFDIVAITYTTDNLPQITHFKDAFFPDWGSD